MSKYSTVKVNDMDGRYVGLHINTIHTLYLPISRSPLHLATGQNNFKVSQALSYLLLCSLIFCHSLVFRIVGQETKIK